MQHFCLQTLLRFSLLFIHMCFSVSKLQLFNCVFLLHDMDSKSLCFITHQDIFNVVRSGDLEGLKEVLKHVNRGESSNGPSSSVSEFLSMQNDAGETLLYIAAENGVEDLFSFLLRLCDLEILKIRSKSDMNAFHVAAKRGHLGIFFLSFCFLLFIFILFHQLGIFY